jgi:hypothetical protein
VVRAAATEGEPVPVRVRAAATEGEPVPVRLRAKEERAKAPVEVEVAPRGRTCIHAPRWRPEPCRAAEGVAFAQPAARSPAPVSG